MRLKGFFWFLTILLTAVCVYQLSFTSVASGVERKAEKEAVLKVEQLKREAKNKKLIPKEDGKVIINLFFLLGSY